MKQKRQRNGNGSGYTTGRAERPTYQLIKRAQAGDAEAMTIIQRHYEPYIRRAATLEQNGTSYLNVDLYERLKAKLLWVTWTFKFRPPVNTAAEAMA